MKTEIRIVIADDHPLFRKGLRSAIESDPSLKVVAEAEDGETALKQIQTLQPEVAILDVTMPQMDGFEVMRAIQADSLPVAVIFLTMHDDDRFLNAALNHGAKGYVLKDSAVNDVLACIRAVTRGRSFISPQLSSYLLNRHAGANSLTERWPGLNNLTATERKVLRLIAANKTSKEIADELCIAEGTVSKHRENICTKLELHGAHALLNFAIEHKSELS